MRVLFLLIPLAACAPAFDPQRDYRAVAECYSAFTSVSIDAADPALEMTELQQRQQEMVFAAGVSRLAPFTRQAIEAAGGEEAFIAVAAVWRAEPDYSMAQAQTVQAKQATYQRILGRAGECHELMTKWGASTAGGVTGLGGS